MPEEKQYKGKERFKGYNSGDKAVRESVDATYDGLDDNLKSFVHKLTEKFGEGEVVFTSGYREGNEKSKHFHGNAVDMRPNPKVWNYLVNEEEGINLMVEHGLNILDESDPKKLKGDAPHFHVSSGKYSNAVHSIDRYERVGTDKFEVLKPFVQVYAEHTGTNYDYSQPVAYDPEKMKYVSENVYKDNYTMSGTGNISMTHYEGYGHDHGQEGAEDNINEVNERLLRELEILRKERESSEAEAELEAEEQEYLNAQQAELNRRNQMVQREQQMISERGQARPVGQIAPQPQQAQPHPAQAFSGQISPPDFIYSLENDLPPLPDFSDGGVKGDPPTKEELEQERAERQEIADRFYSWYSNPKNRDKRLSKYITKDDPLYDKYWDPTSLDPTSNAVMEQYKPDGIYIDPTYTRGDGMGYSYPVFSKKYTVPIREIEEKVEEEEIVQENTTPIPPSYRQGVGGARFVLQDFPGQDSEAYKQSPYIFDNEGNYVKTYNDRDLQTRMENFDPSSYNRRKYFYDRLEGRYLTGDQLAEQGYSIESGVQGRRHRIVPNEGSGETVVRQQDGGYETKEAFIEANKLLLEEAKKASERRGATYQGTNSPMRKFGGQIGGTKKTKYKFK